MKNALFCLLVSGMTLTSCKAVAASAIAYKNTGNEFLGAVFISLILIALTVYLPYRLSLYILAKNDSKVQQEGGTMGYLLSFCALIIAGVSLLSEDLSGFLYLLLHIGLFVLQKHIFNISWGKSTGILFLFIILSYIAESIITAIIA